MHLLGHVLSLQRDYVAAAEILRQLVALHPDLADAHLNLGIVLKAAGRLEEAAECFERVLRLRPSFAGALLPLAAVLTDLGQTDRAAAAYQELAAANPDVAEVHLNLGVNLLSQGRLDDGIASYRKALAVNPASIGAYTNLVHALNFHPGYSAQEIFREHQRWAERYAGPLKNRYPLPRNDRSPERRLRVGYVSPDFRNHSVCYFFEPLLTHHDRAQVEVYCYSDVRNPDDYTRRLQGYPVAWREVRELSDDQLFHAIREDRIDILFDLAGHTQGNRLLTFARKPAPVQMTGIGYINTTGMSAMDYRMTDAYMDPPGTSEDCYSERLARLPRIYMAFQPPQRAPEVNSLPALKCGYVTFASFNGLYKISPDDLLTWAAVLRAVPGSRLKVAPVNSAQAAGKLREFFARQGLAPDRIECVGAMSYADYMLAHHDVDLILDTFPCNGVTTTSHGLWMGVPAVVRAGDRCVSRAGTSLLTNVGLENLIVRSTEEYRDIAVALATDTGRLQTLRAGLREMMSSSPNTDGRAFAAGLEVIYRGIWREWCNSAAAEAAQ